MQINLLFKKLIRELHELTKQKPGFDGMLTYDWEYFSKDFFKYCTRNNIVVFRECCSKNDDGVKTLEKLGVEVLLGYHKGSGKLFEEGFIEEAKGQTAENIYRQLPETSLILGFPEWKDMEAGQRAYFTWSEQCGLHCIKLMALTADKYREERFKPELLFEFEKKLRKLKPKGVIITMVLKCTRYDTGLATALLWLAARYLCDTHIKYFKLLRAAEGKLVPSATPELNKYDLKLMDDGTFEWIVAYSL
jgi:hypothetical protein